MRRMRVAPLMFLIALAVAPLVAQERVEEPPTPSADLPSAPFTMVDAKRFAGVLALGGVAYLADHPVRLALRAPTASERGALGGLSNVAYYYGQPGVAILAAGMWGSGLIADRPTLAKSGLRGMEAIAVSGGVTVLIKELTGRARPDVARAGAKDDWQLGRALRTGTNDHRSMASGHATVAFAFATAVTQVVADEVPEYARLVGLTTFGMAGVTAWQRMYDDRHWLSDVTVGAGIGTVTALAIHRWHQTRPTNGIDRVFLRPIIAPMQDGVRAGLSVEWR